MSMKELFASLQPAPSPHAAQAAENLRYRDFLTVMLIVKDRTFSRQLDLYPRPEREGGPHPEFPFVVAGNGAGAGQSLLRAGVFLFRTRRRCGTSSDEELIALAKRELAQIGLAKAGDVVDGCVVRQKKAYPVYDDDYREHVATIRTELDQRYPNLHLVGRNGMHKYNNQDHAMMTAMLCVENILADEKLYDLWQVNRTPNITKPAVPPSRGPLPLPNAWSRKNSRTGHSGPPGQRNSSARLRAAWTARLISATKPSSAISTDSAAAVVPPGLVTASRKRRSRRLVRRQQRAGAGHGGAGEFLGLVARQAFRDAGFGQGFGHQEQIGGAGARHRGDAVDQLFLGHPHGLAQRRQQRHRALLVGGGGALGGIKAGDAGADGARRVGHGADDARLLAPGLGSAAIEVPAAMEIISAPLCAKPASVGASPFSTCGLIATTQTEGFALRPATARRTA